MNPGRLNRRVTVCEAVTVEGGFGWEPVAIVWADVVSEPKKCVYSSVGAAGDTTTVFTVRYNRAFSPGMSILYNKAGYVIASVTDVEDRHQIAEISAAKCRLRCCTLYRLSSDVDENMRPVEGLNRVMSFPAFAAEKYAGYKLGYFGEVDETLVLVTPKIVCLDLGDVVTIDGMKHNGKQVYHNVQATHVLNEYRNEYEITVKKEV